MRLCMVNLSSHGASEREGETEQQKQAENRRWFIVTGLLVKRESHSWADQWQLAGRTVQECRDRLVEPRPVLFFLLLLFFLICLSLQFMPLAYLYRHRLVAVVCCCGGFEQG